ncbi:acyltransferase family protein [Undibacterium sp. TS12]|uniref:acyltransferase family protein n=1 Tax=Undibacterium sp. TS12 TaxID=2908202 RepID=UPI001F4CB83A|nr:acyltransferase family protein [Undibacterium sp. TS12]MCH8619278.1 acyltransferase family protein [Undibacterium sp. TS12]
MNTVNQRLHALDNLRAAMMWLGIVLHVSVNYMTASSPTPWRDQQTTVVADLLIAFIHAFRMPVFFILAGFFAALLLDRRGVTAMLRQRVHRLVWPFLVFWPLLFISMGVLVAVYAHLAALGTMGIDFSLIPEVPGRPKFALLHLWFIYYLFLYCLVLALFLYLGKYMPARLTALLATVWKNLVCKWWGVIFLALPLAAIGSFYRAGIITPPMSFMPEAAGFIHSGMFFCAGFYLYRFQADLFEIYIRNCWKNLLAGLILLIVFLAMSKKFENVQGSDLYLNAGMALLYNCVSWLWSFALIGGFLKYLPEQNRLLAYLSASSYWVYLVHMLGTMGFGILLYSSPLGAVARMAVNMFLTTTFCLLSYQVLVQRTVLGRFLNGGQRSVISNGAAQSSGVSGA